MAIEAETGYPFTIPDLRIFTAFAQTATDNANLLFQPLELHGPAEDLFLPVHGGKGIDLDLPDLSSFEFGTLENLNTPDDSSGLSEVEQHDHSDLDDGDIWRFSGADLEARKDPHLHSWDRFLNSDSREPRTTYISEAGPQAFDAALELQARNNVSEHSAGDVLQSRIFITCLLNLGLGWSSVLFKYDERKGTFFPIVDGARVSGYTSGSIQSVVDRFVETGNHMRELRAFTDKTYSSRNSTQALIALADAISIITSTLETRLSTPPTSMVGVLQLQALFHRPNIILSCFQSIVAAISGAKGDEKLLSLLFEKVQQFEHNSDWMRAIFLEVLSRVSRPWLDFVGGWIGLQKEVGISLSKDILGKSFVKVEQKQWVDERGVEMSNADFALDKENVPTFICSEDADLIFESGRSLRLLKVHLPDHPLSKPETLSTVVAPRLEWQFSWRDLEKIEAKSKIYQQTLVAAIKKYQSSDVVDDIGIENKVSFVDTFEIFGKQQEEIQTHLVASAATFDEPLSNLIDLSPDSLRNLILAHSSLDSTTILDESSTFAPPIALAPLLSFSPIVCVQARLIDTACLRLLFVEHNLREHLSLQWRFHLFGDGVFASRLSHALFDPEIETAERREGVARTGAVMGLKLGSRESWPPASSELRLALMGVLTETYQATLKDGKKHVGGYLSRDDEMPGGLSFAIRDMLPEELEKSMNPDSVEALDFLRLQYKTPSPLDAVITPTCLYKYDRLFKLLLRVLRMLYVVNELFRDTLDRASYWQGIDSAAQKFRIESHHLVSTISNYFFEVGIGATWQRFEDKLNRIEEVTKRGDENCVIENAEGIHKLREYHERVLDRMMFATLLRKRQEQVMKLLEDIFTTILTFSKYSRTRAAGLWQRPGNDKEVRDLYSKFRKKVSIFVSVCKGLSEKRGYGESKMAGLLSDDELFGNEDMSEMGVNTIGQLLLKLEMNGYYSYSLTI
ncbi:MAG: hypothetical protein M1827_001813 [Pycnora praestabilis]|nr:MAG: hypothetical protein M1827_001813 [Pycnora praestabilis]